MALPSPPMSNERRQRRVDIVAHTHWDREWYAPFPVFRHRLVGLLDELLDLLESEKSYEHFLLDGQMAVVDDYLEIRPEQEPRLKALACAGRLAMGPWYVLMDEFLCSPETIIRNLQLGLARAYEFGGATGVGYLPDMFGHIAQMPQILRQAATSSNPTRSPTSSRTPARRSSSPRSASAKRRRISPRSCPA